MFTLDVCICVSVNVTVKFNIASMETQTQTHRMGHETILAFDGDVYKSANMWQWANYY